MINRYLKTGLLVGVFTAIFAGVLRGQSAAIDSLKLLANSSKEVSTAIDALNELAFTYARLDIDSAWLFANEAMSLANEADYTYGQAMNYRMKGIILSYESDLEGALLQYDQALALFESINDLNGIGIIHNNYGLIYQRLGRFPESIDSYTKSRQIAKQLNDKRLMSKVHNNLGIVLDAIGEYDSAIWHYVRSIELKDKPNDPLVGSTYTNIGFMKVSLGEYEMAEDYYLKAMEIDVQQNDYWGIANGFENLGELKFIKGDYAAAKTYFEKAREQFVKLKDRQRVAANDNFLGKILYEQGAFDQALKKYADVLLVSTAIGHQEGQVEVLRNMAACKLKMNAPKEAVTIARRSFETALKISAYPEIVETANILHKMYANLGETEKAYDMALVYMAYRDSLFYQERVHYMTRIEAQHRLSQIQQQNQLLTKENQLKINQLQASNLKIERQNAIQFALLISLAFAIAVAVFWYRYNLKKQKTIKLLRKLNNEIIRQKEQITSQAGELEKVNADMRHMNESLEVLVKERTKKIEAQNKKLRDYAFSNSHEVRAPLSNLLGLVNISKIQSMNPEEQEEIIEKIHTSAMDLDNVITKVNKILEEEGL